MNFDITEIMKATVVLFAVIDIVGSIPVIIDIKKKAGDLHVNKATLVSFLIMVLFLALGESIIGIFGIGVHEFAVAGAFVLFFLALEMILGVRLFKQDDKTMKTASIVPIAFPLIAGAGTMTSIVSLRAEYDGINILIAIIINIIMVYVVLRLTNRIERILGDTGMMILQKMFGIILLAISVKLFSTNLPVLLN